MSVALRRLLKDLDETSMSLQKIVRSDSGCRTIYRHIFIYLSESSKEISPGSKPGMAPDVGDIAHLADLMHDGCLDIVSDTNFLRCYQIDQRRRRGGWFATSPRKRAISQEVR